MLADEQIDTRWREEDEKIAQWAFSDLEVNEVLEGDYGEEENGFPEEFASVWTGIERTDHRRLSLLADLIANEGVSKEKRSKLLSALYMRLYNSLSAPKKFIFFDVTQDLTRESQKQLLNWSSAYSVNSRNGAIQEYCKDVREMLAKNSTYRRGYSFDSNKGISYDEWLQTVLWERCSRWFI